MSWINTIKKKNKIYKLTENNNIFHDDTNVKLYLHQKIILSAMIEYENQCKYNILYNTNETTIESNEGYYFDPIGTGRSIVLLSLIKYNNKIKNFYSNDTPTNYNKQTIIITKNYKKWLSNNKLFDLNIFTIKSISDLQNFILLPSNELINIDIILIKNAKTNNTKYKNKYLINIFSIQFANDIWKRVILDDFDIIKMPNEYYKIKTLFVWYVSYQYEYKYNKEKYIKCNNYICKPNMQYYNIIKYIDNNKFINYMTILTDSQLLLKSLPSNIQLIKYLINSLNSDYDIYTMNKSKYSAIDLNKLSLTCNTSKIDYLNILTFLKTESEIFNNLFNIIDLIEYYKLKKNKLTNNSVDNILNRIISTFDSCIICYNEFTTNKFIIYKCCYYITCIECYLKLFKHTFKIVITCPFCRTSMIFLNNILPIESKYIFNNLISFDNMQNIYFAYDIIKTSSIIDILNDIINKTSKYYYNNIISTIKNNINIVDYINNYDSKLDITNSNKIIIIGTCYMQLFNIYKKLNSNTAQSVLISNFYKYDIMKIMNNPLIKCILAFNTNIYNIDNAYLTNQITDIVIIDNKNKINTNKLFNNKNLLNLISLCNTFNKKKINIHGIFHSSSSLSNSRFDVNDAESL